MRRCLLLSAIVLPVIALVGCHNLDESTISFFQERSVRSPYHTLGELDVWDDGLAELCYYEAEDVIYDVKREYTSVHILVKQHMDLVTGVKTNDGSGNAVESFKFNIAEEVPTENYNYRYMTSVYLTRMGLVPIKLALSSQEWCGTSSKYIRFGPIGTTYESRSYFPGEGDRDWHIDGLPLLYESLFVVARDVAAEGESRDIKVLSPLRSTKEVKPRVQRATLTVRDGRTVFTPAGEFEVVRVELTWGGQLTYFDVESRPPYRIIAYRAGGQQGRLTFAERRSYWRQDAGSAFYRSGEAP